MRRLQIVGLLAVLATAGGGAGSAATVVPSVRLQQGSGMRVFEVTLGGRLDARALQCVGRGCQLLFLVVDLQGDGARSVVAADLSGPGEARRLASGLPETIDTIGVASFDPDTRPGILIGEPGKIYALREVDGAASVPQILLAGPRLDLAAILAQGLLRPDAPYLAVPRVGRLDLYRWDGEGGMRPSREVSLPARAERSRAGLRLISPPVTWLPGTLSRSPDGSREGPLLAVGPEPQGSRRLRTLLVDPFIDVEDGSEQVVLEAWSLLPAPEEVEWSGVVSLDGEPMLVVSTLRSDKVGLFEKKKVRVFALREDRTREGLAPIFEKTSSSRRWQRLDVQFLDVDLDGRPDLALVQPEGYDGDKLIVDVFLGRGEGRLAANSMRSVVKTPEARWTYGADLTCDGRPDLAVISEARLHIFEGLAVPKKKALLVEQARWSIGVSLRHATVDWRELADENDGRRLAELHGWRSLWVDDVDADGCGEVLVVGVTADAGDVVQVFDVSVSDDRP